MSKIPKPGAVLFAKDVARVARFYEELAGLAVVHADHEIVVLESDRQQLVVHGIPKQIADVIEIESPPKRRVDMPVKLTFGVVSIAGVRARAVALGGELNPARKQIEARGFRACDGHDPEGNVVQFRESAS
jgi:predicted enzyme related to lactoylglutathione lyase